MLQLSTFNIVLFPNHRPRGSSCFKVSPELLALFASPLYDGIIYFFILLILLGSPPKASAANIPVSLFVDPSIQNADAIFNQARQDVLQFASNVTLENVVYRSGPCGIYETDTKDIFTYFQNYHSKNHRITMGPTCSANLLRFANLTAEIQALEINILKGYPYEHPTMIDMITRSPQNLAENIVAILRGFEWAQVGAVLCEECYADDELASETYFSTIESILATNNIAIKEHLKLKKGESSQNISNGIKIFQPSARVLLLFLGNNIDDYSEFMLGMQLNNYTTEEYTPVIVISRNSLDPNFPWQNDAAKAVLFDKTIIIHNNCYDQTKISSFLSNYKFSSIDETIISLQMYEGYHLLGYYLYTASTNTTLFNYNAPEKAVSSMDIHGPFGDIYINTNGQRVAGYDVVLVDKTQSNTNYITSLGIVSANKRCPRLACLHFVLNSTASHLFELPKDVPLCGFHGEICDQTGVIYAIIIVVVIISFLIMLYAALRKCITNGKGRSISNPWLIPFNDLRFIDLTNTDGSHQMSLQSLQERLEERNHLRVLSRNKLLATVEQNYVLVDKFVVRDKIRYDKTDINILYQMRSHLQHDNLNNFMGLSFDRASHIYIVWFQCFRGSLHDHIFTTKSRRETATNFEGAFLRDILKGLDYLHTSPLEFHGNLTLYNCMLDSHWIVKLAGFGVNHLLIKWKASGQIFTDDHTPVIRSEELHYFDPAMKKLWRTQTGTKADKGTITGAFGRKCDLYSFGVCLYEIYFKKKFVQLLFDYPKDTGEEESILIDEENDKIASKYPLPIVIPDGHEIHNDLLSMLERCFGNNRPDVSYVRKIIDTVLKMQGSLVDLMIKNLTEYTQGLNDTVIRRTEQLAQEQDKSDMLLAELIPPSISKLLKLGGTVDARVFPNASILYSDIVGFTSLCSESKPMEVVNLLSGMYQRFDLIISQQGGYKMETIGDAYCVAAGLPIPTITEHVKIICMIALLQRDCLHHFEIPHRPGRYLNCRWGFNSGSVFSGIIGSKAPRYSCFGDTVTLASKMESNGKEDRIQMTLYSQQLLEEFYPEFIVSSRGGISIDGQGFLLTYWLEGMNEVSKDGVEQFQKEINDDLAKQNKSEPNSVSSSASSIKPKDKMTLAKEKVMAERKLEEERLQRQQTLHEALEEHEEEVEMSVVLEDDEDRKNGLMADLASIISAPIEEEEEEIGRTIGHGRLDSQASTIPET
ncbi:unnamed protein product [Caenorhabditis brenneri]